MILPTTIPGSIEFYIACAGAAWVLIFLMRLFYAPIHFLTIARNELAAYRERPIELIFDETNENCIKKKMGIRGIEALRYFVGIHNTTKDRSLVDVVFSADKGWFVENTIEIAWDGTTTKTVPRINPNSTKYIELFGLSPQHGQNDNPDTIFGAPRRFTMRASAKDAQEAVIELEFDPAASPQIRKLR